MAERTVVYTLTIKDSAYDPVVTITATEPEPLPTELLLVLLRHQLATIDKAKAAGKLGKWDSEFTLDEYDHTDGTTSYHIKREIRSVVRET